MTEKQTFVIKHLDYFILLYTDNLLGPQKRFLLAYFFKRVILLSMQAKRWFITGV